MEEKGMARLVLIICLVFGMLVGQSLSRIDANYDKCYNHCMEICFLSSFGQLGGILGCGRCPIYCRRKILGEVCFFKWCRKVKNWFWKLLSFLVLVTIDNTNREKICRQQKVLKVMMSIYSKKEKENEVITKNE